MVSKLEFMTDITPKDGKLFSFRIELYKTVQPGVQYIDSLRHLFQRIFFFEI